MKPNKNYLYYKCGCCGRDIKGEFDEYQSHREICINNKFPEIKETKSLVGIIELSR